MTSSWRLLQASILISLIPVALFLGATVVSPPPDPARDPSGRAIRERVEPAWPPEARAVGGQCAATVTIDRHGAPTRVDAEGCPPALRPAAVEALEAWRWYPLVGGLAGWLEGIDEGTTTRTTVTFRVDPIATE